MYKLKLGLPEHKAFQDAMYHVPMKRKLELIQAKFFFMLFSAYENGGLNSAWKNTAVALKQYVDAMSFYKTKIR